MPAIRSREGQTSLLPGEDFQSNFPFDTNGVEQPVSSAASLNMEHGMNLSPHLLHPQPVSDHPFSAKSSSSLKAALCPPVPLTPESTFPSRASSRASSRSPAAPFVLDMPLHIRLPTPSKDLQATRPANSPGEPEKKSHAKKQPPGHIPRPRNAFILFRCDFVHQKKVPACVEHDHRNISRIAGRVWQGMSKSEKAPWVKLAEQEKSTHQAMYPGYRYAPTHLTGGATKGRDREVKRGRKMKGDIGVEEQQQEYGADFPTQSRADIPASAVHSADAANTDSTIGMSRPRRSSSCPPPIGAHTVSDSPWMPAPPILTTQDDIPKRRPSRAGLFQVTTEPIRPTLLTRGPITSSMFSNPWDKATPQTYMWSDYAVLGDYSPSTTSEVMSPLLSVGDFGQPPTPLQRVEQSFGAPFIRGNLWLPAHLAVPTPGRMAHGYANAEYPFPIMGNQHVSQNLSSHLEPITHDHAFLYTPSAIPSRDDSLFAYESALVQADIDLEQIFPSSEDGQLLLYPFD